MNIIQQHVKLVEDLSKPGEDILRDLTPLVAHMMHMAIGVAGEARELFGERRGTVDKQLKELGDIEFYLTGLRESIGLTRSPVERSSKLVPESYYLLMVHASDILEGVKKYAFYGKNDSRFSIVESIRKLEGCLAQVRGTLSVTLQEVLQENIYKLSKRYPQGTYSNEAAIQRVDVDPHPDTDFHS